MSLLSRTLLANINSKPIFTCNYFCNKIRLSFAYFHTLNTSAKSEFKGIKCNKLVQRDIAVLSNSKLSYMNFTKRLRDLSKNVIDYLPITRTKYERTGMLWYQTLDEVNINEFFSLFNMPDTFFSRFKVIELHVWMILFTIPLNSAKNKHIRYSIVNSMWKDHTVRAKLLNQFNFNYRKNMRDINDKFKESLLLYDVGYLEDDISLANAVWCSFFTKENVDPRYIEALVLYIRHQMQYLNSLNIEKLGEEKEIKGIWFSVKPHVDEVFKKV